MLIFCPRRSGDNLVFQETVWRHNQRRNEHTFLAASGSFWGDTLKWCMLPSKHFRVKKQLSLARLWKREHQKHSLVQRLYSHKCNTFVKKGFLVNVGLPNSEHVWGTYSLAFSHWQLHLTFIWERKRLDFPEVFSLAGWNLFSTNKKDFNQGIEDPVPLLSYLSVTSSPF